MSDTESKAPVPNVFRMEYEEYLTAPTQETMAREFKEIAQVNGRIRDLSAWIKLNAPECAAQQNHLNEGSQERAYWHFGYLTALKDMMRLLTVEVEEKEHLQTIDERDRAEDALSQAYYLITGHSPEWSNIFGHNEAIEDIDDAQKCLRAEIKHLEAERDKFRDLATRSGDILRRLWEKLKILLPIVDGFVALQASRSGNPNIYVGPNVRREMEEAAEYFAPESGEQPIRN